MYKKLYSAASTIKAQFIKLINYQPVGVKLNLFGLKFGLGLGVKDSKGNVIKFEGAYPADTMRSISRDFELFAENYKGHPFNDVVSRALDIYKCAIQANFCPIHYPYTMRHSLYHLYNSKQLPLYIASGFKRHTTAFIVGNNYIYECNRGAASNEKTGIAIYENNLAQSLDEILTKLAINSDFLSAKEYLEFTQHLRIHKIIKMKPQQVGNCSISSHKAAIIAILTDLLIEKNGCSLDEAANIAYHIYKDFTKFYRTHHFNELYTTFALEEENVINSTKMMILSMLSELLLRQHGKEKDELETGRARKILDTLEKYKQRQLIGVKYLDLLLIKKIKSGYDNKEELDQFFAKFSIGLQDLQKEFSLEDQLRFLILSGDEPEALILIEKIGLRNVREYSDCLGYNMLHYAIAYGLELIVDKVICKAMIKDYARFECSFFYYAAKRGDAKLVHKILELIATDIRVIIDEEEAREVIELAKTHGYHDIVQILSQYGIDETYTSFILKIDDHLPYVDDKLFAQVYHYLNTGEILPTLEGIIETSHHALLSIPPHFAGDEFL